MITDHDRFMAAALEEDGMPVSVGVPAAKKKRADLMAEIEKTRQYLELDESKREIGSAAHARIAARLERLIERTENPGIPTADLLADFAGITNLISAIRSQSSGGFPGTSNDGGSGVFT
ncbi:hypothetical protein [Zavarzinella formosa]|uniref:hypothetical protein n=1 Tax=Zavarzinella formosa TaxID=360055 RepID=UPI0002FE0347|nr:hypothetical protein [Zavarzinella formosa]